ncbi:dihydrolipoyl dehydrogenase [Anaerovibrio sp.]|uniref:dihydrolipoyl dehydrogenase n=1 Tax=Anaerovibrio sp. TaxID=1872532 RepID=UPI003F15E08F
MGMKYDIAVIGAGPGGYTAAAKAGRLGKSVVLFEKSHLGGTCLNRGCIPTKALLHSAELLGEIKEAEKFGIRVSDAAADQEAMHRRKNEIVASLRDAIGKLMKAAKVEVVAGTAQITAPGVISCDGKTYEAENIIVAAGSQPAMPPIPGSDSDGVYTSNDLLEGEGKQFASLVIIGGGVIGVECASIYLNLGCKVTIVEMAEHILPPMEKEIAQRLAMKLKKMGAVIEASCRVQSISGGAGNMSVSYLDKKGNEKTACADAVLMAAGRRAALEGLFGAGVAPELNRGALVADADGRTSIDGIYAIGDAVAGNIQLAHVAAAQGENVIDVICGGKGAVDMGVVPSCVYTYPEIASVGLSQEQAKEQGIDVVVKKLPTGSNGKSLIAGGDSGFVKLVAASDGTMLGAQLVCDRATDMIGELAVAVRLGLKLDDVAATIHPHPTFVEMIGQAAGQ